MKHKTFLLAPLAWASVAALAQALPQGGSITQGQGSVSVNGGNMVVNQATQRLVADWQSFSIGAGHSVRFVQPSTSSVALNRVLGSDPSRILGSLTANGHVYLQNAAGVWFAPGAQVDVGGLVATSMNADVGQFMAGRLSLVAGAAAGAVRNDGHIDAAPGGAVVLAAPQVTNAGRIDTPGGTTALVAGSAVDIDPTGSGLLRISVPLAAVDARLRNSGRVSADAGVVSLQAAATDAALRTVMQVGGVLRARSIEQRDGQILLSGGGSGVVAVNGRLDASGHGGAQGGTVEVLGERVALVGRARLDVSGDSGGGSVLVGGNFQGHGPQANARDTYVGSGVALEASAGRTGDGGEVVVWSDGTTTYTGQTRARGGRQGGDGGQVEVSGKGVLNFDGQVDLRAARGHRGSLLLDPTNLDIGAVADVNGDNGVGDDLPGNDLLFADFAGTNSRITAARVATLLASADVLLQATNSLTVSAPLTVAAGGAATTLTLNSPLVNISAPVTLNNSSLAVDTQQDFNDNISVTAALSSLNSVALTSSSIVIDDATLSATNVSLTARASSGASISQSTPSGIIATNLTISRNPGALSSVSLIGDLNQIRNLDLTADSAQVTVNNTGTVRTQLRGTVDGALSVTSTNGLVQNNAATGALSVGGDFTLTTTSAAATGGAVNLANPLNSFGGTVDFDVASSLTLRSAGGLAATGTAGRNITLRTTGDRFTLAGDIETLGTGGASSIAVSGAGIDNSLGGLLIVPTGGRFIIRSSDFFNDFLGPLALGTGTGDINHQIFAGWAGAEPATGNIYRSNQTGFITVGNSSGADAPPVSKVYDGGLTFTHVQTGTSGSASVDSGEGTSTLDSLTDYTATSTGTFLDKNVGTNKGYTVADSTDVVATGLSGAKFYGLSYIGFTRPDGVLTSGDPGNATSEVTPRAITSTGITGVNRVYDGTRIVGLNTTGATLVGTVGGDLVSLNAAAGTGTVTNKNVAPNKAVTITGLSLTGADAGNYTVSDNSSAVATITPLGITATGYTGVNRVYDGSTAVAVNGSNASLVGVLPNDTVTVAGGTGTVADKNADTGKAVTITGLTLGGADGGNYSVTDASNATVDIDRAALRATGMTGVDRVYNRDTRVAIDLSGAVLDTVVTGDTVVLGGGVGTMADKNAGPGKAVAVSGLTLSGADAANYTVADGGGTTVNIDRASLVSGGITAIDRSYNGGTGVALNVGAATLAGVLAGDVVSVSGGTGTMADKNVGTGKAVTVSAVTLGGADGANYVASDASNPTVDIDRATLFANGITGVNRVYDGTVNVALNTVGATLQGVFGSDAVSLVASGATGAMADKNVGTNKAVTVGALDLSGADAGNYRLGASSTPVTVDISALALTAAGIIARSRVENGSTTVALNTDGASLIGVLTGDVVTLDAAGAVGHVDTPAAGSGKPVTVSGLEIAGADAQNYSILPTPAAPGGGPLTVRILTPAQQAFEDVRYKEYLQGVSDAQEPFRRAMAEALAAGFGKENIRKQLTRGLVFETGLAAPAVDNIDSAARPRTCAPVGATLGCAP